MEMLNPIQGYINQYATTEGYIVSRWNKKKPKKLIPEINSAGYQRVWLYKDDQPRKRYFVHRLILETFKKPSKGKNEVNHIDENKQNNKLKNLEWVSHSENLTAHYRRENA